MLGIEKTRPPLSANPEMKVEFSASSNRDERQFENSDMLDITRQNNRHLAFDPGMHIAPSAVECR